MCILHKDLETVSLTSNFLAFNKDVHCVAIATVRRFCSKKRQLVTQMSVEVTNSPRLSDFRGEVRDVVEISDAEHELLGED